MTKNEGYVATYAEYAMEQMMRYGIPASVTLAQGILVIFLIILKMYT